MTQRIFSDPLGLVPIEAVDCNAVIPKGDGGVRDLPILQAGDGARKMIRVAYPVLKRVRKFLAREDRAVLTVVVFVGPTGLEEISVKFQAVHMTP